MLEVEEFFAYTKVEHKIEGWVCCFTVVYTSNCAEVKRSWEALVQFSYTLSLPWLIAGDFNEVRHSFEKLVVDGLPLLYDSGLDDMCSGVGFYDINNTGSFYMWSNQQDAEIRVYCKLNRVMGDVSRLEGLSPDKG